MNANEIKAQGITSAAVLFIAQALEVKEGDNLEKRVKARMVGLGMTVCCSRCGGSGRYSFNQTDGDRCYGCNGRRVKCAKLDSKAITAAQALKASGKVAAYLAHLALVAAAKRTIKPLIAEIKATIKPVGEAYDVAYRAGTVEIGKGIFELQTRASATYYSAQLQGGAPGVSASEVERCISRGEIDGEWGVLFAVEILRERLAEAKACATELAEVSA